MTTLYLEVKTNLKFNGRIYTKGEVVQIEDTEFGLGSLIEDGILSPIVGASSLEEAQQLLAERVEPTPEEEVEPENTWGPKPDEPEVDADENKPEAYTGEMGNYRITGEAPYTDEKGENKGLLEIGTIYELPKPVGDIFVEQGVAEVVEEKTPETNDPLTGVVEDLENKEEDGANVDAPEEDKTEEETTPA